jgi:transposase-like protein/predicted nucleic acid-binding Zn finger protein
MENPRKTRAFGIIGQANTIRQIEAHTFKVRSQSGHGEYVVTNGSGKFECTCPDYEYRVKEGLAEACKHILAVKYYDKIRNHDDETDTIQLAKELTLSCKFCGGTNLVKRGQRRSKLGFKPQYECKSCGKWFIENGNRLPRARVDERLQAMSVDLYFSGFSVRKIKRFLQDYYHVRVSHVAIYKWLRKYGPMLARFTEQFKPELSGVWNADEMKVKVSHTPLVTGEEKWQWLWNVMDNQTRFLLANNLATGRGFHDAQATFHQARTLAKQAPSVVITDGLASYTGAYGENLKEIRNIVHFSRSSLQSGRNAKIERFHGSVREREKVMRSLKHQESAQELLQAYRVWYNYVRPHMGIGGLTPAQAAEVPLELGTNKTLNLIRKAVSTNVK